MVLMSELSQHSRPLESTLQDWMAECRSEEQLRRWQTAGWLVYTVGILTAVPLLWTGWLIGLPASLMIAWLVMKQQQLPAVRRQMAFEISFLQSIRDAGSLRDALDTRSDFWKRSFVVQALGVSGFRWNIDAHVRPSVRHEIHSVMTKLLTRVHGSTNWSGVVLHGVAGFGLVAALVLAPDVRTVMVAIPAILWLIGLFFLEKKVRDCRHDRNHLLPRIADLTASWCADLLGMLVRDVPPEGRSFTRSEFYRQLPWTRRP